MRIGCVVMASGEGARFRDAMVRRPAGGVAAEKGGGGAGARGNKLLAPLAGTPLALRTACSVPDGFEGFETVVSTRWPAVALLCGERNVACMLHGGAERSDAVRAGLTYGAARWDGCLFLPGDQPLVAPESFQALRAAFIAQPDVPVRLSWRGAPASPVLFPRRMFPALLALRGGGGGRSLLAAEPVVALVEAQRAEELLDIDEPADLARAERLLAVAAERADAVS